MSSRASLKTSAALANIRQLCCLGLGGEAIMPTLLEMLPDLVACEKTSFMWANEQFELTNLVMDRGVAPEIKRLYLAEFYNKRESEARPTFTAAMQHERGVTAWETYYFSKHFLHTDFYNHIFRPMGVRHAAQVIISEQGRNVGMINIRRARSAPFTHQEKALLAQIIPYVALGLHGCLREQADLMDSSEFGFLIMNRKSEVEAISEAGRRMLFLASHPTINTTSMTAQAFDAETVLPALCEHLRRSLHGQNANPPVFYLRNNWGSFTFRAQVLEKGADPLSSGMVGVTINMQEPCQLRLMRSMRTAPLSPMQKKICLLLAEDLSHADIGQQLGISVTTVHAYVREIHNKMNVRTHKELLKRLLEQQAG